MEVLTEVDPALIRALRERDEFFWLDLEAPHDRDVQAVADLLDLHPLALEDTLEFGQPPKLDNFGPHVLLVFYTARVLQPHDAFEPIEVHLYIHGGFIMTIRHRPCDALIGLRHVMHLQHHAEEELIVYRILDALVEGYVPVIKTIEERVDAIEEEILDRPRNAQLRTLHRLKQDLHEVSRRAIAQRDQFRGAVDDILAVPGLEPGARPYLADVDDQLHEAAGELGRIDDDLTSLTGTFFNASTFRLSQQAARLSVIATIFFVATLVTSFFGQNFGWLVDRIDTRGDFLLYGVGGLVVTCLLTGLYFVIRRRDYF